MFSFLRSGKRTSQDLPLVEAEAEDSAPSPPALAEAPPPAALESPTLDLSGGPAELDRALDTVARILKTLGSSSFPLDERGTQNISSDFDGWASHVLLKTTPPGFAPLVGAPRRRWADLISFVTRHRNDEAEYVKKAVGGMREAIWGIASAFDRALAQERASDQRLVEELERLRLAAESPNIDVLKKTALAAAAAMAQVIAESNERHQKHTATLADQVKKLGAELADAKQESELDPLTRLANRRAIDVAVERAVVLRSLSDQRACLFLVDLDHFKQVNDTFGHPVGDEVLKRLANCLVRVFPRRTDLVGRYGGEEFCVLLGDCHAGDLPKLSERLLGAIRAMRIDVAGKPLQITASVGYSELQMHEAPADWIARTDRAMYRAKQGGRDRAEAA
ncbi:MAG: GGDEF domain-containing protein [Myxococcota bacterium]